MQSNQDQLEVENKEENRQQLLDAQIQFLVLLQLTIIRIEEMKKHGYIYGNIKNFLNTSKERFEAFMNQVFKVQGAMDQEDAYHVTGKLLTIQEKVEKVLENRYVLTVDERRLRAKAILSQYMIKPMVEKALGEMEEKNLFNF